jgi:hypothetical protein
VSSDSGIRFFSGSIIVLICDLTSCLLLLCLQRWASASYHGQSEEVRQTEMQTAAITRNKIHKPERIDQKAMFVSLTGGRWTDGPLFSAAALTPAASEVKRSFD